MKLLVATDAHILKTPDGKYWCKSIYSYNFWKRYLNVFEEVRIVARTKKITSNIEKLLRVDGPNVEVFEIPFYQGPKQLAINYLKIHFILRKAYDGCNVALFRMPSQTAYMTFQHLPKAMPFAGEIVYDPMDDINDKNSGIIMKLLNLRISKQLSYFCKKANGVSYVTEKIIQEHYPSNASLNGESNKFFETYYSTITLEDDFFTSPRDFIKKRNFRLVLSDVAMNSERKGERTLLHALKLVLDKKYDVYATIIGDGSKKKEYEELAINLGVDKRVEFTGLLSSSKEVRKKLLESDIFVFPTQAEGLPRGIIESMAVGLPVITSPVGGIPEIIDKKYLIAPDNIQGYADKLCFLISNLEELNIMSLKNFTKAQEFKNVFLQEKRDSFYKKLRRLAEENL